jgi:hypothetical protein
MPEPRTRMPSRVEATSAPSACSALIGSAAYPAEWTAATEMREGPAAIVHDSPSCCAAAWEGSPSASRPSATPDRSTVAPALPPSNATAETRERRGRRAPAGACSVEWSPLAGDEAKTDIISRGTSGKQGKAGHVGLSARSMSRWSARRRRSSRLSCNFLPRASARVTLAIPRRK